MKFFFTVNWDRVGADQEHSGSLGSIKCERCLTQGTEGGGGPDDPTGLHSAPHSAGQMTKIFSGSGVHVFDRHIRNTHVPTCTDSHTCLAVTTPTLPAAQLCSLSVGFKAHCSIGDCQNMMWTMRCGRGGAPRSAFQSRHLTGFYPLPCKSDTCLIWRPQLPDPT